jgi:hypothetical protein
MKPSNGTPNFAALFGMLPSMVEGMRRGKIGGKGKPKIVLVPGMKLCVIDGKQFVNESEVGDGQAPVCPDCEQQLLTGFTAFICSDGRALMVRPGTVAENYRGKVVQLSDAQMDALWKQASAKKKG